MNLAARDTPLLDSLRALRCAAAVVEYGSALRAAQALHISQPAVTRAIQALEAVCGTALFERRGRGMAATIPGQRLYLRIQALLMQLEQGAKEARALAVRPLTRPSPPQHFAARVTPHCLRALSVIALGSSETPEAMSLPPSAIRRRLQQLQHLAGADLLCPSPGGTRLTPAGNALLHRIQLAFAELRALHADLAAWRGEMRGELVIGALPLSVSMLLPAALDSLLQIHPTLQVRIIDGTYESLMQQLQRADIDLLFGALRCPPPSGIQQKVLLKDALAVVAHAAHPVFAQQDLRLADLLHHEWVLPLPHTPAEAALHRAFAQADLPVPISRLHTNNPALAQALALQTGRLAVVSKAAAHILPPLRTVPIALLQTERHIGMAWRSDSETAPDLASLLNALMQGATA